MSETGSETATGSGTTSQPTAASRQAARFFVVPAIIVGVCVFCLLVAGGLYVLLQENRDPSAYLESVLTGGGNRRWQAAYELSKVLAATDGEVDDAFAAMLVDVFERARDDDPKVRRYLALALGRVRRPGSVTALRSALGDSDPDTRIYALWGLGEQGDQTSVPAIVAALEDQDPGVRKMAAYALGFLKSPEAVIPLRTALNDSVVDVRWNAAVSLAQMDNDGGRDVLAGMLDRSFLEGMTDEEGHRTMDGERIRKVMSIGIRSLVRLEDRRSLETIRSLSESEPDLRVRDTALKAVRALDS